MLQPNMNQSIWHSGYCEPCVCMSYAIGAYPSYVCQADTKKSMGRSPVVCSPHWVLLTRMYPQFCNKSCAARTSYEWHSCRLHLHGVSSCQVLPLWRNVCHLKCSTVPSSVVGSSNYTPFGQLKHTLSIWLMKIMLCKRSQLCTNSRAWWFDVRTTAHQGSIRRAANIAFSKVHWVYDIEAQVLHHRNGVVENAVKSAWREIRLQSTAVLFLQTTCCPLNVM